MSSLQMIKTSPPHIGMDDHSLETENNTNKFIYLTNHISKETWTKKINIK